MFRRNGRRDADRQRHHHSVRPDAGGRGYVFHADDFAPAAFQRNLHHSHGVACRQDRLSETDRSHLHGVRIRLLHGGGFAVSGRQDFRRDHDRHDRAVCLLQYRLCRGLVPDAGYVSAQGTAQHFSEFHAFFVAAVFGAVPACRGILCRQESVSAPASACPAGGGDDLPRAHLFHFADSRV